LEKLKDKGLSGMDHLSLLLSCYVKNKEENKIKDLLDYVFTQTMKLRADKDYERSLTTTNSSTNAANNNPNNNNNNNNNNPSSGLNKETPLIDPQQSILILTDAGFEDQAVKIAVLYFQHLSYMKIQLSKNIPRLDEALGYLAYMAMTCSSHEILLILQLYGKQLLEARPKQYTTLLTKLCLNDMETVLSTPISSSSSSSVPPSIPLGGGGSAVKKGTAANTTASTHVATGDVLWSNDFLQAFNHFIKTYHTAEEDSGGSHGKIKKPSNPLHDVGNVQADDLIKYFYDDEIHLLLFLEGIVNHSKGRILSSKLWTTFMELNMKKYHFYYLELTKLEKKLATATSTTSDQMRNNISELETMLTQLELLIMNILDGPNVTYDPANALLLCSIFHFEKGERYLLERQQSVDLLIMKLMEQEDSKEVFKLLRKEGTKEPELFVQVLTHLVHKTMQSFSSLSSENNKRATKKADKGKSSRRISDVAIDSDDDSDPENGGGGGHHHMDDDDDDDNDAK
jgi:hypothetical protein